MRVYVAAAFQEWERVRTVHAMIRVRGGEITHDWTLQRDKWPNDDAPEEFAYDHAIGDREGVMSADAFILLTPDDRGRGCGCWIELGMALAENRRRYNDENNDYLQVVIAGAQRDRSIFCHLANRLTITDEEAVDYLLPREVRT